VGGICCKGFLVDARGATFADADIVSLLFTTYRPFLSAGFINRKALAACGLNGDGWHEEALDLDVWCRLATDRGIYALDEDLVDVLSQPPPWDWLGHDVERALDDRLGVVSSHFSREGFFGSRQPALAAEARANQIAVLWEHFRAIGVASVEYLIKPPIWSVIRDLQRPATASTMRSLHRLFCTRSHNLGLLSPLLQSLLRRSAGSRDSARGASRIGNLVWNLPVIEYSLKRKILLLTVPTSEFHRLAPSRAEMLSDIYDLAANHHAARGQVDLALRMWERARPPDNLTADNNAAQTILKLPGATEALIADFQNKGWLARHVGRVPIVDPRSMCTPLAGRKIRIGYHCSFMNSETIRFMMREVLAAHDRSKFEVWGYAVGPVAEDIRAVFDVVRDVTVPKTVPGGTWLDNFCLMPDSDFAGLVRRDRIDVFVELTGFSTGHRFGAMAHRCAPVQVSYLNHTSSSQVPNVDYILADDISVPTGAREEEYYSEHIYRLPGCFFCFDYRRAQSPEIVDPPSASRGYVTFNCFGLGAKFNRRLIELWSAVLRQVPRSKLRLQNAQLSNHNTRNFFRNCFQEFGIEASRLILAPGVKHSALMEAYASIDVSLDTWPYCGGNNVAEALWMGVPVVTLLGDRFASRYGASLITAAGCGDFVAKTPEQYVEIAARLAADLPLRQKLRHNLRRMSIKHGIGDSVAFARKLEDAYRHMLSRLEALPMADAYENPTLPSSYHSAAD
jgi:hypothetical protein